jgi:hypothetical protein
MTDPPQDDDELVLQEAEPFLLSAMGSSSKKIIPTLSV